MKLTKNGLKEIIREEISNIKSITENKVIKLKYEHILAAQGAAAKSKLTYEEGWNILAAYFTATMGEERGIKFILDLEKQHNRIYK
jgi:hypothetical protein